MPAERDAILIGRSWSNVAGVPCPVLIDGMCVKDLRGIAPTVSALMDIEGDWLPNDVSELPDLGALDDYLGNSPAGRLPAPWDLQAVKAAGVTFVDSLLERVIEERVKGSARTLLVWLYRRQ